MPSIYTKIGPSLHNLGNDGIVHHEIVEVYPLDFSIEERRCSQMRPDIVQTYPFIDKWRAKGYQYYVVPKDMLTDGAALGINLDETFLYVVLRDRT